MKYKISSLLPIINEYLKNNNKQDNMVLEKLTRLQTLLTNRNLKTTVELPGPPSINNILNEQYYNTFIDQLSKYRLSLDKFEKFLNKYISKLESDIKLQEETVINLFNYNIDPQTDVSQGFQDNEELFPKYESLKAKDAELNKYQDLKKLITAAKENPKVQSININTNKPLASQIKDIAKQLCPEDRTLSTEREKFINSIRKQLELPNVQTANQISNNLLYLNSAYKPEINPIATTKTEETLITTLPEFEDIATIHVNRVHNDLYCENGINNQILTMYKQMMANNFETALPKIEKSTNNPEKINNYLKNLDNIIKIEIQMIKEDKLTPSQLKLIKEKYPRFYKKSQELLHTKDQLQKEYESWKGLAAAIKQISTENKISVKINYYPKQPINEQIEAIKDQIEKQLGKPLKEFSVSTSPKKPGGGSDFR